MNATEERQLVSLLGPGERIIHAGLGQWVQLAEKLGRGGGEGLICVTDIRAFHAIVEGPTQGVTVSIPRSAIIDSWSTWIPWPLAREVHIRFTSGAVEGSLLAESLESTTDIPVASFYAGRGLCRRIVAAIGTQEIQ